MKKLIGLDIGTTNVKAEIYDEGGRFLDNVTSPYKIYFGPDNLAEQNAEDWENKSIEILNSLFEKYTDISAVGLSIQEEEETVYPNPSMKAYHEEKFSYYVDRVNSKINNSLEI